jgi:hypothetical protein
MTVPPKEADTFCANALEQTVAVMNIQESAIQTSGFKKLCSWERGIKPVVIADLRVNKYGTGLTSRSTWCASVIAPSLFEIYMIHLGDGISPMENGNQRYPEACFRPNKS